MEGTAGGEHQLLQQTLDIGMPGLGRQGGNPQAHFGHQAQFFHQPGSLRVEMVEAIEKDDRHRLFQPLGQG